MKNIKVSVIVPVFNAENYLIQCLDSIVKQTYANLEIILINDGSTDKSKDICDLYQKMDRRIRVISQDNKGLSYVRQRGIETATGDCLMIVDSDDWLELNTIEKCIQAFDDGKVECVMFSYVKEYKNKSFSNHIFESDRALEGVEVQEIIHRRLVGAVDQELKYPEKLDNLSSVCMKLYSIDMARKGKCIDRAIVGTSEDTLFNLFAFEKCKSVVYLDECFYHYRKTNEESITTRYKEELSEKWDSLYSIIERYIEDRNYEKIYTEAYYNRIACGIIGLSLNEIQSKEGLFKQSNRIRDILKKERYKKALKNLKIEYMPIKWKIFFLLCKGQYSVTLTLMVRCIQKLRSKISH